MKHEQFAQTPAGKKSYKEIYTIANQADIGLIIDETITCQFLLPTDFMEDAKTLGWEFFAIKIIEQDEWQNMYEYLTKLGYHPTLFNCTLRMLSMAKKIGIAVRVHEARDLRVVLAKVWN